MKKIAAGYYEEDYKGKTITVHTTFMEWENKEYWVALIDDDGGDDLFRTKKQALKAAKEYADYVINELEK